jgi:hypothetical protein
MSSNDRLMKRLGNVAVAVTTLLAGTSVAQSHPLAQVLETAKTKVATSSEASRDGLPSPLVMKSASMSNIVLGHESHSSHSSHSSHRSHYSSSARN